jgi:ferric-dicitrate binding protein FerR (iron transport regulator)
MEGSLSETEARELQAWKAENPENKELSSGLLDEDRFAALTKSYHPDNQENARFGIWKKIASQISFKVIPFYRRPFFRVAVAAASVILLFGATFLFLREIPGEKEQLPLAQTDVEAPKVDKAMITLADGHVIAIDSLTSLLQVDVKVTRMADGRLIYSGLGTEVSFNTLTNPKGSKVIDLTLSDGSRIWLNAGSSVRYPVTFVSKERRIDITGEVYVKVAHNPEKPFIVSVNGLEVLALGTEFNINAYPDEKHIHTTLVEGSVRVSKGSFATLLQPGQQTQLAADGTLTVTRSVNMEEVTGWKEGFFHFESADIKTILREFARWYDIDVVYEGTVSQDRFFVIMNRTSSLATVLKGLKAGGVKFSIEGKKLTVKSG